MNGRPDWFPRSPQRQLCIGGLLLIVAVLIAQAALDSTYGVHRTPQAIRLILGVLAILALGQLAISLIWTVHDQYRKTHPMPPSKYRRPGH